MSPSATIDHNTIAAWLANALEESNPGDRYVIGHGQSVTADAHNEPCVDVVVADISVFRMTPFPITQLALAVEVVSPHSVLRDTETKRALYARAGVPSYWIVVPDNDAPTIALAELVLEEKTGQYTYRTHYTTDIFTTDQPWNITVDLPALTAKREGLLQLAVSTEDG